MFESGCQRKTLPFLDSEVVYPSKKGLYSNYDIQQSEMPAYEIGKEGQDLSKGYQRYDFGVIPFINLCDDNEVFRVT